MKDTTPKKKTKKQKKSSTKPASTTTSTPKQASKEKQTSSSSKKKESKAKGKDKIVEESSEEEEIAPQEEEQPADEPVRVQPKRAASQRAERTKQCIYRHNWFTLEYKHLRAEIDKTRYFKTVKFHALSATHKSAKITEGTQVQLQGSDQWYTVVLIHNFNKGTKCMLHLSKDLASDEVPAIQTTDSVCDIRPPHDYDPASSDERFAQLTTALKEEHAPSEKKVTKRKAETAFGALATQKANQDKLDVVSDNMKKVARRLKKVKRKLGKMDTKIEKVQKKQEKLITKVDSVVYDKMYQHTTHRE